jgi:pyridoxamine 5'-phosphate oxidase family protein
MSFTELELGYLATQQLGRLATAQPNGTLQVNPVGFRYNSALGTIDIGGFNMAQSQKFRNIADNARAAFVIDDIASVNPWRVRCLEIRGRGEAITTPTDSAYEQLGGMDGAIIRIHPQRILSFGIGDLETAPHDLVANRRNVNS